ALGETMRWNVGLSRTPVQAKAFYSTIVLATLLGAVLNVMRINPMKALLWSAVLNGVVAVPVLIMVMLLGARADVMGKFRISTRLRVWGWIATAVMTVASAGFLYSASRCAQSAKRPVAPRQRTSSTSAWMGACVRKVARSLKSSARSRRSPSASCGKSSIGPYLAINDAALFGPMPSIPG